MPRTQRSAEAPHSSSFIADRERDRENETNNFLCYFCRARLEPNVLHYCGRPSIGKKRCGVCKTLVPDNASHRCTKVVTTTVTYEDPDLEEIDEDIEEKLASSVKVAIEPSGVMR